MSCCGEKRQRFYSNPYAQGSPGEMPSHNQTQMTDGFWFEYTGNDSLTVKGEITASLYRFGAKGALIEVDRRDATFMTGNPDLRKRHRGG